MSFWQVCWASLWQHPIEMFHTLQHTVLHWMSSAAFESTWPQLCIKWCTDVATQVYLIQGFVLWIQNNCLVDTTTRLQQVWCHAILLTTWNFDLQNPKKGKAVQKTYPAYIPASNGMVSEILFLSLALLWCKTACYDVVNCLFNTNTSHALMQ